MTPDSDFTLLEKLILGQLPVAETERLAAAYAEDKRIESLAEALIHRGGDRLIDTLRHHRRSSPDTGLDRLVNQLVRRLREAPGRPADASTSATPPTAPPMPERLEDFHILKVLGEGGMGTVYLANDTRLGRLVALKTLRCEGTAMPQARERFLREARSVAKLDHDHIVPIYYVGEVDGIPFLTMPFLQGEPLSARLLRTTTSGESLPVAEATRIAGQIALGLAQAHARGLIHRDIKPANIWLEAPTGRVKILDFGLARGQQDSEQLTGSGMVLGTPAYMSPEQAAGMPVDPRSDLFNLGCVLYEMLTGEMPLTGRETVFLSPRPARKMPAPHAINPQCPPELSNLTMQLLAKQPDQRPASAAAVAAELARMAMAQPPRATAPAAANDTTVSSGYAPATVARPVRPRLAWFLLGAGALFLVVLAYVNFRNKDGHDSIARNGPETIANSMEKTPPPREPTWEQTDRAAADWVISIGGAVRVNGQDTDLKAVGDLPREAFRLTGVFLSRNPRVTDAGLACFRDCKNLTMLNLEFTKTTDAGLAYFKNCRNLTYLNLYNTQATDVGLAHFQECKGLTVLHLYSTQVTDTGLGYLKNSRGITELALAGTKVSNAGLAQLENWKDLTHLDLGMTKITDAGLVHLKHCEHLTDLALYEMRVSDAGLAHLKACTRLSVVDLTNLDVSDAGLAHLKDCKNLKTLNIDIPQVTDAGLAHLKDCKNLMFLSLNRTKVTAAGIAALKKELPECRIKWNGEANAPMQP